MVPPFDDPGGPRMASFPVGPDGVPGRKNLRRMQLSIKGKQLDVGDALRVHVGESLSRILGKYFGDALDVGVTLSREGNRHRAAVAVHIGRGMQIQAQGEAEGAYPAFDTAAEHLAKRLRRYKRRLRDHRKEAEPAHAPLPAQQYVLAGDARTEDAAAADDDTDTDDDTAPVVIAEMATEVPSLTVSEAVMRLDLGELPALMFRSSAHGGLNMIYRRPDGHIGWVDPHGNLGQ